MNRFAKIIPKRLRRSLEVFLIDRGWPTPLQRGQRGIELHGHRLYVGALRHYDASAERQLAFLVDRGLKTDDVLCDVGCGSLRAGRKFIAYLDPGHYLGLEGEGKLVELGLEHEMDPAMIELKKPEFVISYKFEFDRFSRAPTFALANSVFSHLIEQDIRLCLRNLADRVTGHCQFYASFFAAESPTPNFKSSHPHLAYYYTRDQMARFGADSGWDATYIGDWGSPSGQVLMKYETRG